LIYNNREKHRALSGIVWAEMESMIDSAISDRSGQYILNWLLLTRSKYFKMCDTTYLIKRDNDRRIAAVLERDNITSEYMAARDRNGIEYNENDFSWVVHNNG